MSTYLDKIRIAVSEETNAGGFPQLIQTFKAIGIIKYNYLIDKGMYEFLDETGGNTTVSLNGVPKVTGPFASAELLKEAIHSAQAGKIDFENFCKLAGEAGVGYWTADLLAMVVIYYDQNSFELLREPIPQP